MYDLITSVEEKVDSEANFNMDSYMGSQVNNPNLVESCT